MKPTDIIHPSWELPLELLPSIRKKLGKFNPAKEDLFRVFNQDIMNTQVICLGLSPYQALGKNRRANGLAFGSNVDTPSLEIIREALWETYRVINIEDYFDNTMEFWHQQGILMLNSSLTVPVTRKYGNPKDHLGIWHNFIRGVLDYLYEVNPVPVWFMGNDAREFKKYCLDFPLVLESCHPVATKYAMNRGEVPLHLDFRKTPNFKKLDDYFIKLNGETLRWYDIK